MIAKFIFVVVGMIVFELIWTECVIAVQKKDAMRASIMSAMLQFVTGAVTLVFISSPILLTGCALGAFAGTYMAVRWHSHAQ